MLICRLGFALKNMLTGSRQGSCPCAIEGFCHLMGWCTLSSGLCIVAKVRAEGECPCTAAVCGPCGLATLCLFVLSPHPGSCAAKPLLAATLLLGLQIIFCLDARERFSQSVGGRRLGVTEAVAHHLAMLQQRGIPVESRHLAVGDALWVARSRQAPWSVCPVR